jgi:hypothetical protein
MGIEDHEESELADLEMETKPEDVLAEIARLQQRAQGKKHINSKKLKQVETNSP